ncbi:MAG TPA: RluA family pseudouridine synthase [Candidatus Kapabacteria bacterium]|nr:RluA family pseudouridine synthase [Candidatus Kapabacteria bacterium]
MTDPDAPHDASYERVPVTRSIVVTAGQMPERIDRFITHAVMRATRNKVQSAIDAGAVLVNGRPTKANYKVRPGDEIEITLMKPPPITLVPQNIPLDIVYEDADLLVVNKAAGMVTHPGYGNRDGTLVNAVLYHVGSLPEVGPGLMVEDEDDDVEEPGVGRGGEDDEDVDDAEEAGGEGPRPGIVHRLDKETSGLMVVAKNTEAQVDLARQFAERTAKREYWAVAWGVIENDEGEIEASLGRDTRDRKRFAVVRRGGKYALTRYRVIRRFEFATLVALRLATGRTHQIRVHMAHIGHPLFGDPTYGGRAVVYPGPGGKHRQRVANLLNIMPRQALHARTLGITQPRTREWLEFESELPADMLALIDALQ